MYSVVLSPNQGLKALVALARTGRYASRPLAQRYMKI